MLPFPPRKISTVINIATTMVVNKLSSMMTFNSKVNDEPLSIYCWIS